MEFKYAIVKTPCAKLASGLTTANLGAPDYVKALAQHRAYVNALRACGLSVTILVADDEFPDSTFVEDTALLAGSLAVITNPGAPSRQGETHAIEQELSRRFTGLKHIVPPGTVDAGDIMTVGTHIFIGLSTRTNRKGAEQLTEFLKPHNCTASTILLRDVLHLKSAVSYLENNNMLATPDLATHPDFAGFNIIEVPVDEQYAANSLWLNGTVLVPAGYPKTKASIQSAGYDTIELDTSEFRKLDGGLSCLSLRY